jgi:hypothetical protein
LAQYAHGDLQVASIGDLVRYKFADLVALLSEDGGEAVCPDLLHASNTVSFFLPDLRALAKYGDICGDNAKASGAVRSPWTGPEKRPALPTKPHSTQVSIFALLQSMHSLADRHALGGLKSGFAVDLDWSSGEVEVIEEVA